MLYPNFNDLIGFKGRKLDLKHPAHRSVKSTAPGNHHSPFRGQGLEFDAVREYVPGDDIRRIDWRVTARTGSPHLKVFKEDRERQITICIDMNAAMRFGTKKTFKSVLAAHVAALLGWQGIAQQDRVSVYLFGDVPSGIQFFAPKRTKQSFCAMLKALTEPPFEHHYIPLQEALKHIYRTAHTGSLIYLISDFMNLDKTLLQDAHLNQLSKRCDLVCISVNDQSDKSIYPMGFLGFHGQNKEHAFLNTRDASGREAYELQWKENRQQLLDLTSRFKIPTIELTTESDVHRDLMMELQTIAKRRKR